MPTEAPTLSSSEARDAALAAASQLSELRSKPEGERGDTFATDLRSAIDRVHEANALFDTARAVEAYEAQRSAWDHAVANPPSEARGPQAAFADGGAEMRTAGQEFTESDAYRRVAEEGLGAIREAGVEVRNLLTSGSEGTSGSNLFVPVGSPFLSQGGVRRRRLFVRDVIPVVQTGLASVPYIRELNAATNETGAGTVSEASAKPEATMQFESADAPIRKIAAWIQITEEALADAPTLRGYVDTRLSYMLAVKEETQLLAGDGTAPNIKGITDYSSIQTQSAVADDLAGTVGLAIGKVENVDGMADGVAINTLTYWTGVVERHANQMDGGATDSGLPFSNIPASIWGLPVIRTRSLDANKAIVGDWGRGATIFERMGTTIKASDSHASLFISNTWVVLAEKRVGLAVHRPDFFVDTTLSFS